MTVTQSHEASPLVTKVEAADALRVSIRTINRYIADGTLAAIRVSPRATRITRSSVEALLAPAGDAA
jgi:excisionase family DNA binding protein